MLLEDNSDTICNVANMLYNIGLYNYNTISINTVWVYEDALLTLCVHNLNLSARLDALKYKMARSSEHCKGTLSMSYIVEWK